LDSLLVPTHGRTIKYVVLLPADSKSDTRYPVLYLLHGLYGSHTDWTTRTKLVECSASLPLIIVMPDAENSWYTNSWNDSSARFEDFVVRDLAGDVAAKYCADTTRQAIAGLSMGGYGALKFALKYPSKYIFAAGLSSAITIPRDIEARERQSLNPVMIESLHKAFAGSPESFLVANDVLALAAHAKGPLPYFYLVHGVQDSYPPYLLAHRALVEIFQSQHIVYEYHEVPGEHNWVFWDKEIQQVLSRLMELLPPGR
jgi:S-formylglutathione hydrolase FrmB